MIELPESDAETLILALGLAIEYTKTEVRSSKDESHRNACHEQLAKYDRLLTTLQTAESNAVQHAREYNTGYQDARNGRGNLANTQAYADGYAYGKHIDMLYRPTLYSKDNSHA
jgi:hypothetical protein